jgi:hypothetical protein
MASVATPQLLNYSEIVDVDLDGTNDVNFADVEDYGHRVMIDVNLAAMNDYLKWERAQDGAYPVASLDSTKESAFKAALDAALSQGFVDIDGVSGGLHFGTTNFDTNPDTRKRINGGISANDIALCFVLYRLYGSSAIETLNNIYNLEDAYGMLSNSTVSTAIVDSFKTNVGGAMKDMLRDLISADPHRFFDASGVPMPGIFEINPDEASSGSWNITENDIIEVKVKFIFQSKVTRRGVAGREHNLTNPEDATGAQENQQTIINPNDYFYVRLQMRAKETAPASGTGESQGGGGGEDEPTVSPWGGVAAIRSTGNDEGLSTATDSNNNIYLIANISSSVEISNFTAQTGGVITPSVYATLNGGGVCIIKYSSTGNVVWATNISGAEAKYITTDTNGNVYVAVDSSSYNGSGITVKSSSGSITSGVVDMTTYTTIENTVNTGEPDTYIVKYNTSGEAQWATRISGGVNRYENISSLVTSPSGELYAVGNFGSDEVNINSANINNPTTPTLFGKLQNSSTGISNPGSDIFIVKYNTSGEVLWATKVGRVVTSSQSYENGKGIAIDSSGNIYISGSISGSPTVFNFESASAGTITLSEYAILNVAHEISGVGSGRLCIIKYNSSGKTQWVNMIGDNWNLTNTMRLTVDSLNNIYATGYSSKNVAFFNAISNSTPGNTQITPTYYGKFINGVYREGDHCYLVKYNSSGVTQWATILDTNTSISNAIGIVVDSTQNVYIHSLYTKYISQWPINIYSFDTVNNLQISLTQYATMNAGNSSSAFLIKFNSFGAAQWATKIEGGNNMNIGYGLSIDSSNNLYATGGFSGNPVTFYNFIGVDANGAVDLQPYGTMTNLAGLSGFREAYLAKYNTNGTMNFT